MSILDNTKSKFEEFFLHLAVYGGFKFQNGLIIMWNDVHVFTPTNSFFELQNEIIEKYGDEGKGLIYWLGKINGKTGTIALTKRFGLKESNFDDLLNGASVDGWGKLLLQEIKKDENDNPVGGTVISQNSTMGRIYYEKIGKCSEGVDHFIRGELSGGAEPLFNRNIYAEEVNCIAKGDDNCVFNLSFQDINPYNTDFMQVLSFTEDEIIEKALKITLKRKSSFGTSNKNALSFGNGRLSLNGEEGVLTLSYVNILLQKILLEKDSSFYKDLIMRKAKNDINVVAEKIKTAKNYNEILKHLEIFGYGQFNLKVNSKSILLIENELNPFGKDYLQFFGKTNECVDIYCVALLNEAFSLISSSPIKVEEVACMAKGDQTCRFKITR